MKNFILISLLLFGSVQSVRAEPLNCNFNDLNVEERHNFPAQGYWMQAAGNDYVTFTAVGGIDSGIYDLKNRRRARFTTDIDAFPLPEGDLYVHPSPIRFYRVRDGISSGNQARPVFTDPQHQGYYQSVGVVSRGGNKRTVRILAAEGRGTIQDYEVEKNGDQYSFNKLLPSPRRICQNVPNRDRTLDWSLPILSRDGSMLATIDYQTQKTKIYKIRMPSGDCQEIADLGVQTDKVSFSFDNNEVAFAVIEGNGSQYLKRLKVYNLKEKKSYFVSGPGEHVNYHGFRPDGRLMYTRSSVSGSSAGPSELVMVNTNSLSSTQGEEDAKALGEAWARARNRRLSSGENLVVGKRFDQKKCNALVAKLNESRPATSGRQPESSSQAEKIQNICQPKQLHIETPSQPVLQYEDPESSR